LLITIVIVIGLSYNKIISITIVVFVIFLYIH